MARNKLIRLLRTTRAALNAQRSAAALQIGEPYLVTDEGRLAVGTAAGAYVDIGDVTLAGAQTLSNKTLAAPVINGQTADVVKFAGQVNAGNSGTAVTVDFVAGQKQALTLTGNATVTLAFPGVGNYQLLLAQDATGSRTVTWSGVSRYVGSATAPAINTAANSSTMVSLYYDGTSTWLAASKVNA